MRGTELHQARQRRLTELRRELAERLRYAVCLDELDLLARAELGDQSSLGNVTKRRLIVRQLVAAGYSVDGIAQRWNVTRDAVAADLTAPLIDPEHRADTIVDQVLKELVETPEPGRYVAPTGEHAVPGVRYPTVS